MGRPCDGHAVIGFLDFRSLCHANLFLEKPTRAVMAALGQQRASWSLVGPVSSTPTSRHFGASHLASGPVGLYSPATDTAPQPQPQVSPNDALMPEQHPQPRGVNEDFIVCSQQHRTNAVSRCGLADNWRADG